MMNLQLFETPQIHHKNQFSYYHKLNDKDNQWWTFKFWHSSLIISKIPSNTPQNSIPCYHPLNKWMLGAASGYHEEIIMDKHLKIYLKL